MEAVRNMAQIINKLLFIGQIPEVMTTLDKLFAVSGNTPRILGNRVFKDSL